MTTKTISFHTSPRLDGEHTTAVFSYHQGAVTLRRNQSGLYSAELGLPGTVRRGWDFLAQDEFGCLCELSDDAVCAAAHHLDA